LFGHSVGLDLFAELLMVSVSFSESLGMPSLCEVIVLLFSWTIHRNSRFEIVTINNIEAISESVSGSLLSEIVSLLLSWTVHSDFFTEVISTDNIISISESISGSLLNEFGCVLLGHTVGLDLVSELLVVSITLSESLRVMLLGEIVPFLFSWTVHSDCLTKVISANDIVTISESVSRSLLGI
jgi:WD40 repeat protein